MGRINTGGVNKRTGDNIATGSSVSGTTLKLTPPKGYYDGSTGTVNIIDSDFIAGNIKNGVNLFGKVGTLPDGTGLKKVANGTNTSNGSSELIVTGLTFTPKIIVARKVGSTFFYDTAFYNADFNTTRSFVLDTTAPPLFTLKVVNAGEINATGFLLRTFSASTQYTWTAYE